MDYLFLIGAVVMNSTSSLFGKAYNLKNADKKDITPFYNFALLFFVFLGWCVLYAFNFSFDIAVLPYSIGFALFYACGMIGMVYSLKFGPASLTSLFVNLSLLPTVIWGFFFWGEEVTALSIIGLVLVVISVYLCLYTGKTEDTKFSWKWLIFVLMAFIGNAGCCIVQRQQQTDFGGKHGVMLMVFAILIALVITLVLYLRSDKSDTKVLLRSSIQFPSLAGICNVILNFCAIMLASSFISPSLIYPLIGVGGLAIVSLFSLFLFKEKLRWWQWLGFIIGAVATVLLSI